MPPMPPISAECGNGVVNASEQCDPSAPNGTVTCTGEQKCAKNCKCVTPPATSPGSPLQPIYQHPSATPFLESTTTGAPPAGFEDEVITNPTDSQHNWFTDVKLEDEVGQAANLLADKGIIGGYSDGTFRPDKTVNRAEAAKFLLLARYGSIASQEGTSQFRDVMPGEWYVPFIIRAAETGVIGGYADGTFRPANTVNTAEFLKMLSVAFQLPKNVQHNFTDVSAEDWFAPYVGSAFAYKLFPDRGLSLEPQRLLTRGEVAVAIARILKSL
ncbi:MAG: S-layer homology domain-containing protein [Candidatus Peribacter sp.]|nr:S-layer homology domain-containing protein [Candidatus Peribacter sp.]